MRTLNSLGPGNLWKPFKHVDGYDLTLPLRLVQQRYLFCIQASADVPGSGNDTYLQKAT